jgi:serine/threonine protein kinase
MINNRYKILNKLGEGRSSVYRCTDIKSGYEYAVKIISPLLSNDEYISFSDEYNTIRKLNHPGIIKGYESGTILESDDENILKDSRYILLEYFNGKELSCVKNISEAELRKIIIHVASVLQYLHMSKFIYFDLKPENILTDGNSIKLIDFGFTQIDSQGLNNYTRGTTEYIAPELLKKDDYDYRVDYYSLGIMLYKLIYGRFPFSSSSELVIYKEQVEKEFEYPENCYSPEVNKVLRKLLQKEPVLRYRNAMQIYSDLDYAPGEEIISSWVPSKNFSGRKDVLTF